MTSRCLSVGPGHRVLEVGTGTGWSAGLLARRVGAANVVSVEIDAALAERAAENLRAAGIEGVRVMVGDGTLGWPEGAPYDRVHVTAGTVRIPYAWVEQTRPGGVVVLPWMPGYASGYLVRLTVAGDGTASGPIGEPCGFMPLRAQRTPVRPIEGEERESPATVPPQRLAEAGEGFNVAAAALLPGVEGGGSVNPVDGSFRLALRERDGDSHALAIHPAGTRTAEVTQRGTRDLWDELVAAWQWWVDWGRPGRERFGLTVDTEGIRAWLERPDRISVAAAMRAVPRHLFAPDAG
ncbi:MULTISPECIES: methyltransferase domain-containing protein [Actinomadura]|uniref:Protein-L-isoaspartate O-methyltransferase n=2 Tax=Actinomadura yumaensis TaxID=111807 RepID=A0ABW2CC90_9ACTN|nr:methyltransferase domain-containing protein [Actinomadura sp. J1-007]